MDDLFGQEDAAISFDYQMLTHTQRQIIQQRTEEIRARLRRSAQDIWEIGQRLAEVRSQLKRGQFETWLGNEFGWSRRTAYNFISVYEAFQESVNFAEIDIATSALYLLASPSTPENIRTEVLQQAQQGEKIAYKDIQRVIKAEKSAQQDAASGDNDDVATKPLALEPESSELKLSEEVCSKEAKPEKRAPEIIAVIPKPVPDASVNGRRTPHSRKFQSQEINPDSQALAGWYHLNSQHLLFCGDTASSEFFARIPHARLVLAITSDDWDHDWIVEKADSVLILREAALKEISLEQMISTFSKQGDIVVFPWLPDAAMLSIAHAAERRIFAGDPDPQRCALAIAAAEFNITPFDH